MSLLYRIPAKLKHVLFVRFRIWKYYWLSTCKNVNGSAVKFHPVLICGKGTVSFGKNVQIGVINAPHFYTGYAYIEARNTTASVHLGNNISMNNALSIIAESSSIRIEDEVLIGFNCHITDSDFHEMDPKKRTTGNPVSKPVLIQKNVFIGSNVSILKGVTIGENTIIGHGAVVVSDIPANVIAGGVPAKVLKTL